MGASEETAGAATWVARLGAFYDADGVCRLLCRGGRPVSRRAASGRELLALRTRPGRLVYPAFQFRGGAVLPGLDRLLEAVPEDAGVAVDARVLARKPGCCARRRHAGRRAGRRGD